MYLQHCQVTHTYLCGTDCLGLTTLPTDWLSVCLFAYLSVWVEIDGQRDGHADWWIIIIIIIIIMIIMIISIIYLLTPWLIKSNKP